MKKRSFPRLAVFAAAALVAVATFTSAIHAAVTYTPLLALKVDWPQILFDNTGQTSYVAGQQLLKVDADATNIQFEENGPPFPVEAIGNPASFGSFNIRAVIDHDGKLVGGIPPTTPGDTSDACDGSDGDDFCVTGVVLDGVFSGVLLKGEVVNFASRDGGSGPDQFEFHIKITGGTLMPMYPTGHIVVPVASEPLEGANAFDGTFNADFGGLAKGTAGLTDIFVESLPPPPPPPPPPATCDDPSATNFGGALPCAYPPPPPPPPPPPAPTCDDTNATNYGGELPCTYPPPPPPPPVISGTGAIVEATDPTGATVNFVATATDYKGSSLSVSCSPASGTAFGVGTTDVLCTSEPDDLGQTGSLTLVVMVHDTTPPEFVGIGDVEVEVAFGQSGTSVIFEPTASDLVDLAVAVACTPPSGSSFPTLNPTLVTCTATDSRGNVAHGEFYVTVNVKPPELPGGSCFVVDFREITYFKNQVVITSSNAPSGLNPALWPYSANGGAGRTKSRGTLFRIYGFQPSEYDYHHAIPNADNPATTYPVQYDGTVNGFYIDLGGPARVMICPDQLHDYILTGKKGNGHVEGSTLLPLSQRNVPGIMLSNNSQIVNLPLRVRKELYQLGLYQGVRGLINYVGFQLQGNGSAEYREFVDVEVQFPGDSQTNRLDHFEFGFHTAINTNFESFAGCNYVDYAPGNDAVRLHDVWGPNRSKWQGYASWQACGSKEPGVNKRRRANYDVPFSGVQLLSTVNTNSDTLRLFYGTISPLPERELRKKDHKYDWREWDSWDY